MNNEWRGFLESQSAQIDADGRVHFGTTPAFPDCALCDLSHLGLIELQGGDTREFLQGQFTNDSRNITDDHSQLSGYCNTKGRMLANFRIFRRDDRTYLQFPRIMVEPMLKRLQMFVLRSQVALRDASDELVRIGVAGDCAESALAASFPALPQQDNGVIQEQELTAIRIPAPGPRFEVIGPAVGIRKLWQQLTAVATPVGAGFWSWLDILAGIPTVYPETSEAFVPQMANMQLVDGLSFTKGCYTGQEVVARMQYLGKLKRRMYLAHVETDTIPQPGDTLFSSSSDSGQGTGKIVEAAVAPGGGVDLLAVVEITSQEQSDVCLGLDGPRLEFRPLAYAFNEEEAEKQH